jgi:hypothetical protein
MYGGDGGPDSKKSKRIFNASWKPAPGSIPMM